jgi:hypothetical protein
MTRPVKPLDEQPVLVFNTEVRIYASEPDLQAYFQQFKPGQYATAIKRAVRAALSGGGLELGGQFVLPTAADDDDDDDFSEFVS